MTNAISMPFMPARAKAVILKIIADAKMHQDDFYSRHRQPYHVEARRRAAIELDALGYSCTLIARFLNRNHSTVLNYLPNGRQTRRMRHATNVLMRRLPDHVVALLSETAKSESSTPIEIMARWIEERAAFEVESRRSAA